MEESPKKRKINVPSIPIAYKFKKPYFKPLHLLKKINLHKFSWKKVVLVLIFLLLIVFFFLGFVFLKHRQLCRYENLTKSGQVLAETDASLCPNLLDTGQWEIVVANAFDFGWKSDFEINTSAGFETTSISSESCSDTDPVCLIKSSSDNLKKTDNYTNILIVGSDTRLRDGSVFGNTDTIILATYNHETGNILLTSFPRDTYVLYDNQYGQRVSSKINSVYVYTGAEGLQKAMADITGMDVHYYVVLSMNSFNNFIDKIGGIKINLPEPFADVFPCSEIPYGEICPAPQVVNGGMYGYYTFPAGENYFDSFDASVYSRARQYSDDYSRAKRQQLVIQAVISNALNNDKSLSEKFSLYQELYNIFRNEVETNLNLEDVGPFLSLSDKVDTDFAKVVLDPSFENGQVVYIAGITEVGWATKFYDMSYGQIRGILKNIVNNMAFYQDRPKLLIYKHPDKELSKNIQDFVNSQPSFVEIKIEEINTGLTSQRIYDFSNGQKSGSLKLLSNRLDGILIYNSTIDDLTQSAYGEDILIIDGVVK